MYFRLSMRILPLLGLIWSSFASADSRMILEIECRTRLNDIVLNLVLDPDSGYPRTVRHLYLALDRRGWFSRKNTGLAYHLRERGIAFKSGDLTFEDPNQNAARFNVEITPDVVSTSDSMFMKAKLRIISNAGPAVLVTRSVDFIQKVQEREPVEMELGCRSIRESAI